MGSLDNALRRLRHDQDGFSLIELLVVCVSGVLLFGVGLGLYQVATRGEANTTARSEGLQRAQSAMERMTRELRQGSSIVSSSATSISFETYVRGVGNRRVRYICSGGSCTRAEAASGTNNFGTAETLVTDINPNVFTISAGQVGLRLRLTKDSSPDAGPGREVGAELSDGVTMRNAP